jgi:hypothetical protein
MRFLSVSGPFRCCECGLDVGPGHTSCEHNGEVFCCPACAVCDPCESARDRQFSKLERRDLASKLEREGQACNA